MDKTNRVRCALARFRLDTNSRTLLYGAALASVLLIAIAGCTRQSATATPTQTDIDRAATAAPSDARLADLYRQSCRACHSTAAAGAPLAGHREAWDERWEKGADALRSSTIRGLNGMPPGGQCFACTPQDYDALIRFMAGR